MISALTLSLLSLLCLCFLYSRLKKLLKIQLHRSLITETETGEDGEMDLAYDECEDGDAA